MEDLNNVPSTGTFGNSINQVNQNFGLVKGAIENVEGRTIRSKGLFPTQAALTAAYPSPKVGDYAYVGSGLPATIYDCVVEGTWHNTGQTGGSETVDLNNYSTKSETSASVANSLAQATARMGYGEATASNNAYSVTVTNYTLPTNGGNIRVKMPSVATGAATLDINSTGAKILWYNGKAVSSTNTWEAQEIISVFYDGTKYMSSNSQGGGGDAEKINYDNSQSGLAAENVQVALDEVAISAIKSYSLTHIGDFIPATLWSNKSYEGLGLYTKTGYYSFGLVGLQAGAKVLLHCAEDTVITQQRSYVSDNYIIKQMNAGDTKLKDLTPVDISPTLKLYTLPSDRTNIGFTFNGNPEDVRYYILSEDSNIKDFLDEKSKPVDGLLDGLFFPINERLELNFISPSANLIIGTNNGYWVGGSSTTYCRFIKVEPNTRYLVQAESNRKVQVIQLQDTSASNGAFPHYAGGVFNKVESSVNGESLIIDTMKDCEYLYFLVYGKPTSISLPSAITKRVIDTQKFYEEIREAPVNIAGIVELAPISGNGCHIDTNTWKWASDAASVFSVIYKVVGGSRLKITANSQGRAQCNLLKSINATAGDNVDFATGYEQVNIGIPAGTSTEVIIPNDAEYLYCLNINSNPILAPAIVIGGYSVNGIDVIDFVGDSLTQRGYSITKPQADYPSKVIELTGVDGYNIGVGGENVATILGRCDGIPWKLASDVAIPADTTKVQIYLTNIYGQHLLPLLQRYTSHTIVIDGIEGTLTTTQTREGAANADYFFQRKVSDTAYNAKAGDDIFVQDFKATLNPHRAKIIWVGQNGGYDKDSTYRYGGDITNAEDRARLIHMIKTYISVCACEYYMVLSPPEKTNDDLEKEFAEAFGNRYFNVRKYMINHGIDDAIALGYLSASGYPTAQDITDMNNGVVPTSLRADRVHFSTNGSYTMAHALSIKLKEVWNL